MDRAREQTWLISAVAIVAHACLLAGMLVECAKYGDGLKGEVAVIAVKPYVPPPKPESLPPVMPAIDDALGEKTGVGDSIKSVDLPDEMRSPKASELEQAWTRCEPVVAPPAREAAKAQATGAESVRVEETAATASERKSVANPLESLPFGTVPTPPKEERTTEGSKEVEKQTEPAAKNEQRPKPTLAETAAVPQTETKPAPKAESDLDPFAKEEGVDFTAGGIKARQGREVKLVRPRVDLGFMADFTRMYGNQIVVKLEISTDPSGKPRLVDVKQSSGSEVIDNAVRVAAYDSWFGGRMPDEFPFTIRFLTD